MSFIARVLALFLVFRAYKNSRSNEPGRQEPMAATRVKRRADRAQTSEIPTQSSEGPGPDSPLELQPRDFKQTIKRTVAEIKEDRITFAAAAMAYYFFLAIFPAVIAFIGILGLVEVIDAQSLIDSVRDALPGGAGQAFVQALQRAERPSEDASLTAAIFGIGVALWSASSGFVALQQGLNIAYDVKSDRKFVGKRAIGLLLLLATLLLGGVPSPFFTFGESTIYVVVGWVLTVLAVMVMFGVFYHLGPNRERPSWRWVSAGGIVGALLWLAASLLFGFYVDTLGNYGKTYGTLGGVVVLLLFLYLSSLAVLIGGELNAELERQAARSA